ncbi:Retrovirus-related Pol polyprotein from transposon TNT 1-94 [Araneus ventricosus]|uniref:Retrovirus-related Pol polyprotein from transposon TNT 1-94 n=1 Tax=Araneus ventricosus TaxID=182803 RepID=A0A4Y2GQ23_ARAVE|nr:Retrovirus-related Pol polyprotein from transposon TNT 1-94 [Araneus ventricosus]
MRNKFDIPGRSGIMLGYARDRRGYQIYDIKNRIIIEKRSIKFNESLKGSTYLGKTKVETWNIDSLFESTPDIKEFGHKTKVNHLEISAEPAANENNYSIPFETLDDATNTVIGQIETPVDQMNNGVNQIPVRRSERLKAKQMSTNLACNVLNSYLEDKNSADWQNWEFSMKNELDSLNKHKVWEIVDRLAKTKLVKSKLVYSMKQSDNGETKYKARLVAAGFNQIKNQDYLESYSPVVNIESFRFLIALASKLNLMVRFFDVKTAYLYSDIEETVYMLPPPGFERLVGDEKLLTYDGNPREWLNFWTEFQKIHEDASIDERHKYQYLIQSTVPGSTPREIVESFPATAENYKKAVEYIKERFRKESVLAQVYIKDSLQLVISKNMCELSTLYDKLQTRIRSLDSLGLTKDKYADILFPLVESTLPIDIVKMWDRQRHLVQDIQVLRLQGANIPCSNTQVLFHAESFGLYYRIVLDTARSKLGTFVQNRVREIRSLTSPTVLRHVPESLNDADLVSRGCSGEQLLQEKWWGEPSWLSENEESWPKSEDDPDEDLVSSEKRKTIVNNLTKSYENVDWYYKYVSSVRKIVRMLAWIFRFYNKLRKSASDSSKTLSVSELEKAEISLMLLIQKESFKDVNDDKIKKLIPIIDYNDLIRSKTNFSNRDNTNDFKFPIILPSDHTVVKSLIMNDHNNLLHAGTFMLMSHLREKYWIIKTRRTIRNCIRKCINYQRFKVKKCEVPKDRVRDATAFEILGVDLAGHLYLRKGPMDYIVLYTCAVHRAIHLELITSLTTEIFLQSLRRFITRRGRPTTIYFDNGTNFKAA